LVCVGVCDILQCGQLLPAAGGAGAHLQLHLPHPLEVDIQGVLGRLALFSTARYFCAAVEAPHLLLWR